LIGAGAFGLLISTCTSFNNVKAGSTVTVCHLPAGSFVRRITMEVPINTLQSHLNHGDFMGSCGGEDAPEPSTVNDCETMQVP